MAARRIIGVLVGLCVFLIVPRLCRAARTHKCFVSIAVPDGGFTPEAKVDVQFFVGSELNASLDAQRFPPAAAIAVFALQKDIVVAVRLSSPVRVEAPLVDNDMDALFRGVPHLLGVDGAAKGWRLRCKDRGQWLDAAARRPLAPAAPRRRASACDSGHWLDKVSMNGEILVLEDGSVWRVDPVDAVDTSLWLPTEEVVACDDTIINTDNGEKADAIQIR